MSANPAKATVPPPKFYRSDDGVDGSVWLIVPLVGGAAAAVLGLAYAFVASLIVYVFESPAWFIMATPLFAAGLAAAGQWVCNLGKVRRRRLRLPIAMIVGAIGLYASWHFYLNMASARGVFDPAPSWAMSPARVARGILQLAHSQGVTSWLWWLLEAATVFGMIAYLVRTVDVEIPFCQQCGKWTDVVLHLELDAGETRAAADRLRSREAPAIGKLAARKPGATAYALVRVFRCPCTASCYASVDRAKVTRGKKAGVRYRRSMPGASPSLQFDPGSGDTTDLEPVLTYLEIDDATERQLEAVRDRRA